MAYSCRLCYLFFSNDTATTEIYTNCHTLSLHDALPISATGDAVFVAVGALAIAIFRNGQDVLLGGAHLGIAFLRQVAGHHRSEEHTSELQSLIRISYAVFCFKKTLSPPK